MQAYLSIDLGTTGCRSVIFDEKLNLLAYDYEEYDLITPRENYVEQDAELWWSLTLKTAEAAIKKSGVSGKEIKSISISSQGITIVPVDNAFKPLANALSWLDTRATAQAVQIEKEIGFKEMFELTGKRPDAVYTLPKLLWLKKNCSEVYEKAHKFLMPMEFLVARFTGKCITDHSMASGTLMYDLEKGCWSSEILSHYEIDRDKLPEIAFAGSLAGCVLPEVAKKLGLSEHCTVAVGAQDQKCAAYGAGLDNETITLSLGTAAAVTRLWNTTKSGAEDKLGRCGYIERNSFVTEGVINTAGTCLRWLRDMLFKGEDYDVIDAEASHALEKESSLLFFPYLGGPSSPFFYPESTGCFYGMNLATTRGDFALSVMEGIAYQLRILLEEMDAYKDADTLILFGGGANGELWPKIIADITGMTVKVPKTTQVASAGAARLAAKAVGDIIPSLEYKSVFVPTDRREEYLKKYQKYREIEERLWKQGGEKNVCC